MSANQNEYNPLLVSCFVGSPTVDKTVPVTYLPRKTKVIGAYLLNNAGIAADNANYAAISLKVGGTTIGSLDTRAANQGAVTQNAAKAFAMQAANQEVPAGSTLTLVYDETDAGTNVALTDAQVVLQLAQIDTAQAA